MNPNQDPNNAGDDQGRAPGNPGSEQKAELPDPNVTDPANVPPASDETGEPFESSSFAGEHHISPEHSEPTDVTKTSNDNYIEGKYIDVGGGD